MGLFVRQIRLTVACCVFSYVVMGWGFDGGVFFPLVHQVAAGQQLQPLRPDSQSQSANTPAVNPTSNRASLRPVTDEFLIDKPDRPNAAASSETNTGQPISASPLQPLFDDKVKGASLFQDPGSSSADLELMQPLGQNEADFVQAMFVMPGPKTSTSPLSSEVLGAYAKPAKGVPPKNESLLEVERDLNRALRDEQTSFLDGLQVEDFFQVSTEPYRIYRASEASLSFLPKSSRSLGWTSMEFAPYLKRSRFGGVTGSIQHHFLNGPLDVDLPPRLHDFILGYQHRGRVGERVSFDCAASVGVFSDFQGSVREGVRFPAHAVGMFHFSHRADFVLGVDYLDRDDYRLLPVIGISWHDLNLTALRYDLVFPRPRIDFTINDGERFYIAGRLGGGTWDIEYPSGAGDVMTYRDFRLLFGKEKRYLDGSRHSTELGYVFGRRLQTREALDDVDFSNAIIIRLVSAY